MSATADVSAAARGRVRDDDDTLAPVDEDAAFLREQEVKTAAEEVRVYSPPNFKDARQQCCARFLPRQIF